MPQPIIHSFILFTFLSFPYKGFPQLLHIQRLLRPECIGAYIRDQRLDKLIHLRKMCDITVADDLAYRSNGIISGRFGKIDKLAETDRADHQRAVSDLSLKEDTQLVVTVKVIHHLYDRAVALICCVIQDCTVTVGYQLIPLWCCVGVGWKLL